MIKEQIHFLWNHRIQVLITVLLLCPMLVNAQENWHFIKTLDEATHRHENAFINAGDKYYLIGGRGMKPVEIFDPADSSWTKGAVPPVEMSHFQAVALHGLIYVLGGFSGNWPSETPLSHIFIYNPLLDKWLIGPKIPEDRQRGAAGVVVRNEKIYLICGIVNGHTSGWVPWFDVFDPTTNLWSILPDAPRSRDHFQAVLVNNKIVVAGGRKSGFEGKGFEMTIAETDIFDFDSGLWSTAPSPEGDIPTQRAGCTAIVSGTEVIIIGGESGSQGTAHNEMEAFDIEKLNWRKLSPLNTGRHGTQAFISRGSVIIGAGCGNRGGNPELNSFETYKLNSEEAVPEESITPGSLHVSHATVDFSNVEPYSSSKVSVALSHDNGNQGIPITYISIAGNNEFTADFPYSLPYILNPNQSVNVDLSFNPEANQKSSATLLIKIDDKGKKQPIEIPLNGNSE